MKKAQARTPASVDSRMVWALFDVAKRAWYKERLAQDARYGRRRPEPPDGPVPGQGWYADPSTLQIQLDRVSPAYDKGSSVKIKPDETDLLKAFCPRPFLIVSNKALLAQKRAWVCPLSTSVGLPHPDWIVPVPELATYALSAKLHTVDTEFFADVARRDLLCTMEGRKVANSVLDADAMQRVRSAIEAHLSGAFAPARDPLPPGSIVRRPDGSERYVLANCDLGNVYRGAGTLSTTCLLRRSPPPTVPEDVLPLGVVPLPVPSKRGDDDAAPEFIGYLDLGHVASELQSRLVRERVGEDMAILPTALAVFERLLLGGNGAEGDPGDDAQALDESARAFGDLLREDRRAADASLSKELAESEREFDAMVTAATEPDLFGRAIAWLRSLDLTSGLLVVAPVTVRGNVQVRRVSDDPEEMGLAAESGTKVEIAFENHHDAPVWVVACERDEDGTVSFIPETDLSHAPRIDAGDSLTFSFTPTSPATTRVVAIALHSQPQGVPAEVLADPSRLQSFGVVATTRFTLRIAPTAL